MLSQYLVCVKIKPRVFKFYGFLIKATPTVERLNVDFKDPLLTSMGRPYMFTIDFYRLSFVVFSNYETF